MSMILLYPKLQCEVGCAYCFGAPTKFLPYDKEKMAETLRNIVEQENQNKHGSQVCLHGGEVCKLPIEDFEFFIKETRNLGIIPSIMTSTYGMTSEHIRMFKFYNIGVGVSLDGPPELNILRGPRDPDKNKVFQQEVQAKLKMLKEARIPYGTITVLTKINAVKENLDILLQWAKDNRIEGRFNPVFSPNFSIHTRGLELTAEEAKIAWIKLADLALETGQNILPIREFMDNLLGYPYGPCWTARCDYATSIVKLILPTGQVSTCDRCLQDGVRYREENYYELRSQNLRHTDCKGCKYFEICGGGCPGETIDRDPRNKSRYCEAAYGLYSHLEKKMRGMFPQIFLPGVDEAGWYKKSHDPKTSSTKPIWFKKMDNSSWRSRRYAIIGDNRNNKRNIQSKNPKKTVNQEGGYCLAHCDGWS